MRFEERVDQAQPVGSRLRNQHLFVARVSIKATELFWNMGPLRIVVHGFGMIVRQFTSLFEVQEALGQFITRFFHKTEGGFGHDIILAPACGFEHAQR